MKATHQVALLLGTYDPVDPWVQKVYMANLDAGWILD